uniref:PDZ domain-containing protein n=1 Tax=Globodera rostochiensis TaxID=31243 RepID=A0A914GU04_GLORO
MDRLSSRLSFDEFAPALRLFAPSNRMAFFATNRTVLVSNPSDPFCKQHFPLSTAITPNIHYVCHIIQIVSSVPTPPPAPILVLPPLPLRHLSAHTPLPSGGFWLSRHRAADFFGEMHPLCSFGEADDMLSASLSEFCAKIGEIPEEELATLKNLLEEFDGIFALHENELTQTDMVEHAVDTEDAWGRKGEKRLAATAPAQTPSAATPLPVLHDSFHFFGIPLRTPSEYYRFLDIPSGAKRESESGAASERHFANILGVGWTECKSAQILQRKQQKQRKKCSDPSDQCVCTCALSCTSSAPLSQKPSLFGRAFVQLPRGPEQQLGLGIAGGSDRPIPPTISYLRPGFVAHRCDQLQIGDRLISVDGVRVETLTHLQVLALLRNAGIDSVELELEYDLNSGGLASSQYNAGIRKKTADIELVDGESAEGTFGMTVRGGAFGPDPAKSRPLTVTSIRVGGAAHRESRLRVGDRLLAINGVPVQECTLAAALNVLRSGSLSGHLLLNVEYDVCLLTSLRRLVGPLLLEIEKVPGIDFGIELDIRHIYSSGRIKRRAVIVKRIVPASIADRCGAVQIGDELLAIDGISLEMVSGMAEAYQLLRSQSSMLRLELLPGRDRRERKITRITERRKMTDMDPLRRSDMDSLRRSDMDSLRRSDMDSLGRSDMDSLRRSDMDPLRRSDMDPLRRSDMDPLRRSDMDPLRRSDMDPLRRSDMDPLRRSDMDPLRRSDMDPLRRSDMDPLRRSDMDPLRRSDMDPLRRSDMDPLRRSDMDPLRRSDMDPLRRSDMDPLRRSDMDPLRRSDMDPLRRSDMDPLRRSDMDPLRRLNSSLLQLNSPSNSICSLGRHLLSHPRQQRQPSLPPQLIRSNRQGDKEGGLTTLRRRNNKNSRKNHAQSSGRMSGGVGSITAHLSSSFGPNSMGTICHPESMELKLTQKSAHSWDSFGILLGRQRHEESDADGLVPAPLLVERVERGSPADKCGLVQPGDRILCINDWNTTDGILEEAQSTRSTPLPFSHLLRACSFSPARSVILLVEFNVIEPVLPPGPGSLFVVRLARRGSSLGIVCRSEHKGAAKGEPLIISDVRMGSVAHRCGSIQTGDRIHSIDNIPLEACTVEESIRLLQRSAPIVKLCIAKGGGEEQDILDSSQSVVYSVELSRNGQPLGVTIASAGGVLDPIVISQLMPGGLAERTSALHVGDHIVAINGESMEGKKVGQVTQLLQHCPDPLKLCIEKGGGTALWCSSAEMCSTSNGPLGRCSDGCDETEEASNKVGTPIKSVDSAMDSMEDSPSDIKHSNLRHGTARLTHLRPSTSNNFQQGDLISEQCSGGWDSGLSSAAATDSQNGGQQRPFCQSAGRTAGQERCCGCRSEQPSSTTASNSPQSSSLSTSSRGAKRDEKKEDWARILDALETVGEEEMLRNPTGCAKKCQHFLPFCPENGVLSRRFLPNSNSASNCCAPVSHLIPSAPAGQFAKLSLLDAKMMKFNGENNGNNSPLPTVRVNCPVRTECVKNIVNETSTRPQTPVLGLNRRVALMHNSTFLFELPPSMPSPRPTATTTLPPLLPFPRHPNVHSNKQLETSATSNNNASTFTSASSEEQQQHRSSSAIPFITLPTISSRERDVEDQMEEANDEREDQFDELSEVFSIQLCRCSHTKSFGFSVCDGTADGETGGRREQQKQGIFVRSLVKNGPADKSGRVRPGDRILQINGRSIQFLTCDLALPLLATERVDLLLLRKRSTTNQQ